MLEFDDDVTDIDRAINYALQIEMCQKAQRELKAAFHHQELDGGAKAALEHPLYLKLEAEIAQYRELLVGLV